MQGKDTVAIKPYSVRLEVFRGCNLKCEFCPTSTEPKHREAMGLKGVAHIAAGLSRVTATPRLELAQRGEPLLHPQLPQVIETLRRILPQSQIMVTSNGALLFQRSGEALARDLFRRGLNILLLDCYDPYGERLVRRVFDWKLPAIYHDYSKNDGFSPWHNHGPGGSHVVFVPDLLKVTHRHTKAVHNWAGTMGRVEKPLKTACPLPWRDLVIRYDGTVPICCRDWREVYKVGNALETPLADIWTGPEFVAARRFLRYGDRWFEPCRGCDGPVARRVGLLPKCEQGSSADRKVIEGVLNLKAEG